MASSSNGRTNRRRWHTCPSGMSSSSSSFCPCAHQADRQSEPPERRKASSPLHPPPKETLKRGRVYPPLNFRPNRFPLPSLATLSWVVRGKSGAHERTVSSPERERKKETPPPPPPSFAHLRPPPRSRRPTVPRMERGRGRGGEGKAEEEAAVAALPPFSQTSRDDDSTPFRPNER